MALQLVRPSMDLLASYLDALDEGRFTTMQLGFGDASPEDIRRDPAAYLEKITDPAPIIVERAGRKYHVSDHELLWIADGSRFVGTVALRFAGDAELLEIYAGHIGMAIRPRLLNKGFGIRAVENCFAELAARARVRGRSYVIATCEENNRPSARLIEHFGGRFEARVEDILFGGTNRRYRIDID